MGAAACHPGAFPTAAPWAAGGRVRPAAEHCPLSGDVSWHSLHSGRAPTFRNGDGVDRPSRQGQVDRGGPGRQVTVYAGETDSVSRQSPESGTLGAVLVLTFQLENRPSGCSWYSTENKRTSSFHTGRWSDFRAG